MHHGESYSLGYGIGLVHFFLIYGELITKFLTFAVKVEFLIRNSSNISNVRSWP